MDSPAPHHPPPPTSLAAGGKMGTQLIDIPEHLQAEILLRLPGPEDLACISAGSVTFHRLVSDRSFLRRFRRLHAPRFLGFLDLDRFHPACWPHPSASAAHALDQKADFTFSFVPPPHHRRTGRWAGRWSVEDINHVRLRLRLSRAPRVLGCPHRRRAGHWVVQDIRDGRVLLRHTPNNNYRLEFTELAVSDPLHRRYILLPAVPKDLAALVVDPDLEDNPWCQPFLLPLNDDDNEQAAMAFGVIWMVHCLSRVAAFVFSSSTGRWQTAGDFTMMSLIDYTFIRRHYAYGCFYWELNVMSRDFLMLDTGSMDFSIVDLPPGEWIKNIAIVEAGEGRIGMFGIPKIGGDLCYYIRGNESDSSSQWQLQKTIPLVPGCQYVIKAATESYLLLSNIGDVWWVPEEECISTDVKKLQLERVCVKPFQFGNNGAHIYTNFPPSLSTPTI